MENRFRAKVPGTTMVLKTKLLKTRLTNNNFVHKIEPIMSELLDSLLLKFFAAMADQFAILLLRG